MYREAKKGGYILDILLIDVLHGAENEGIALVSPVSESIH